MFSECNMICSFISKEVKDKNKAIYQSVKFYSIFFISIFKRIEFVCRRKDPSDFCIFMSERGHIEDKSFLGEF